MRGAPAEREVLREQVAREVPAVPVALRARGAPEELEALRARGVPEELGRPPAAWVQRGPSEEQEASVQAPSSEAAGQGLYS